MRISTNQKARNKLSIDFLCIFWIEDLVLEKKRKRKLALLRAGPLAKWILYSSHRQPDSGAQATCLKVELEIW